MGKISKAEAALQNEMSSYVTQVIQEIESNRMNRERFIKNSKPDDTALYTIMKEGDEIGTESKQSNASTDESIE